MNFLSLTDFDGDQIQRFIDQAKDFKENPFSEHLNNQVWGLLFYKSSTRTRLSFEVGIRQMSGSCLYLDSNSLQVGRGEPVSDTAKVLSRYIDGVIIRTFDHQDLIEFSNYSNVPVVNGLTDLEHPCQIIADLLTISEYCGSLHNKRICYVGDASNNVCRSLMQGASRVGMKVSISAPKKYWPDSSCVQSEKEISPHGEEFIHITEDINEAVQNCDIIYTDVWISMGQEKEKEQRVKEFGSYQINKEVLNHSGDKTFFMHCLPAYRGYEVTDEVMNDERSIVFDQAENRLHAQKAILAYLTGIK